MSHRSRFKVTVWRNSSHRPLREIIIQISTNKTFWLAERPFGDDWLPRMIPHEFDAIKDYSGPYGRKTIYNSE